MSSKIEANILAPIETHPATAEKKNPAVQKVAQQYEALFVNQLVTAMRKTVSKGGFVPESNAERVYQSMLDSEYAQKMAETEQLGLSKLIYDHLLRNQGNR
jgi:Rod binding domain-containing protein